MQTKITKKNDQHVKRENRSDWFVPIVNDFALREKNPVKNTSLRFCPSCKDVWEKPWVGSAYKFVRYEDFPSYGLKRKECVECLKIE